MTKQEAIENHRAMWNWIADQIEQRKQAQNITELKYYYIHYISEEYALYDCFCCEYDYEHGFNFCTHCPLVWPDGKCGVLFGTCYACSDYMGQAMFARQIANLPERKDA